MYLARVALQERQVLVARSGGRVMVGRPALLFVVPDERWKVDNPGQLEVVRVRPERRLELTGRQRLPALLEAFLGSLLVFLETPLLFLVVLGAAFPPVS